MKRGEEKSLVWGWMGVALLGVACAAPPAPAPQPTESPIERGRYLVKIAGCNDCHTAGFTERQAQVPESEWLKGDRVGWHGPWGTTYATNLRLHVSTLSEDQWVQLARISAARPPMPTWALKDMKEADLRAIYQFIRSLGEPGEPAPTSLPPGQEPPQPFIAFPAPPPPPAG